MTALWPLVKRYINDRIIRLCSPIWPSLFWSITDRRYCFPISAEGDLKNDFNVEHEFNFKVWIKTMENEIKSFVNGVISSNSQLKVCFQLLLHDSQISSINFGKRIKNAVPHWSHMIRLKSVLYTVGFSHTRLTSSTQFLHFELNKTIKYYWPSTCYK